MSRSLLRRLGAFVTRESALEDSIWRLRAFCEKAQDLLAQVNASIVHPRNFIFHLLAFVTDDFADWTSPPELRELLEIFCGCPVDSSWDDEVEAAQVISEWLSEASTFISPAGDDSVPVLAHFLRLGSPFPDYPGDEPVDDDDLHG
jgi:hypothetical protein